MAVTLAGTPGQTANVTRTYAWVVFALSFGLLISDYMSRQVLNAVFPLLKLDWNLTDAELGSLSGIVALMVGLLTFPLSLAADRWGRIRSLTLMAMLWSLATLGCALSRGYEEMFWARLAVGVGEAAYGSVGIAVVLSVFPQHLRATVTGAFMAGGMFGSVLGMGLGGAIADQFGWRWAFAGMALIGLVLATLYPIVVRESKIGSVPAPPGAGDGPPPGTAAPASPSPLRTLFSTRSVICAYVGSGLQLFISGALLAWMPSFLNRYYHMDTGRAGGTAALFVLCGGAGMVLCGMLSDRLGIRRADRKIAVAIGYCVVSGVLLFAGFQQAPGMAQLMLIGVGMFFAAGTSGPAGAMVANLTHPLIHGTAFATLTLANNLLGLAPGPFVTGLVADRIGLSGALEWLPLVSLGAIAAFLAAYRVFHRDLERIEALRR
ncbi:MAG: MFS transporter [Pseudomonadales bacterium]